MPFDINTFTAEINKRGIARPSNYDMLVFGPKTLQADGINAAIPMRCLETELPGRQIQTVDLMNYGLPSTMPTMTAFTELTLKVLLDEKHEIREYFEQWIDKVVGNYRINGTSPNMFNLGFYDDFVGTIEISNYDELAGLQRKTTLVEVYPKSIVESNLTWDSTSDFMYVSVNFVFRRYFNT